ncbi:MAG: histidinol-phosphate aminotransferase family protein [Candidatus Eisenbacteria bacterium]|nr:histidinol-phosphate aminotransferase family protein [Candidatus Eisenbacteria bacterium]
MNELPPPRRSEWSDLALYQTAQAPVAVDLSDNTSRFGVPPSALAELRATEGETVARYPSGYGEPLKSALAEFAGVERDQIVTGCGSDDVLDSAIRAFGRPGDTLSSLSPTFPMPARFARLNGLRLQETPLHADGAFDPDALLAGSPAIVYLCTPNNPTGTLPDGAAVDRVIARAKGIVILDEAYAEFAGASRAAQAPARGTLLVVRTMSKAFGLAGLRVGWAAGAAALVRDVELSRGPYTLNALAERAAAAALRHDAAWVMARAAEAVAARDSLAAELRSLGLSPLPSAANFLLVPVPNAALVAARMRDSGVAVRAFANLPGFGNSLRIHAAPAAERAAAVAALKEALACA